jgi:hypothetical protein
VKDSPVPGAAIGDEPRGEALSTAPIGVAGVVGSDPAIADGFLLPGEGFFQASQLTSRPQVQGIVALDAPEILFSTASVNLVLDLWINEAGEVVKTTI